MFPNLDVVVVFLSAHQVFKVRGILSVRLCVLSVKLGLQVTLNMEFFFARFKHAVFIPSLILIFSTKMKGN